MAIFRLKLFTTAAVEESILEKIKVFLWNCCYSFLYLCHNIFMKCFLILSLSI